MSKGQIVGFVALGALASLLGVAIYSSRSASGSPQAPATATDSGSESSPTKVPVAEAPQAPRLTESLPRLPGRGSTITAVAEDVMLSPAARLLAERLKCVCGCDDILAICSCTETPGSRDMKKYLQELVNERKTPAEIESAMVARYGQAALP